MATIERDEASIIMEQYKQGLNYQRTMGFNKDWPENDRFKQGNQWPPPTEKTKNLPRPVFNIIKYICTHKVASVLNENIKMLFTPMESPDPQTEQLDPQLQNAVEGAEKFTKFSDTTWEQIQQDKLNEEALENGTDAGSGIWHYYWDSNKTGGTTLKYIGEMCGEIIDPLNYFPGNPQQRDVQKQPYNLITSRDTVANIKAEAKANNVKPELIELIVADKETTDQGYDAAQHEMDGVDKATIITKYWSENGTIHFTKVCSGVVFKPKADTGMKLYPIVVMPWEKRKKSIFGIPEVEGIIPNQKGINFLLAMMLLSAQQTAWPKLIVKGDSLRQAVKNEPGEILTDFSMVPGDNIKYMQTSSFNPSAMNLLDKFFELTKTLAGATETSTGSLDKAGQFNAQAIMLLQQAAGVPIEQIKKRFYRAMEDVGRIWAEFYRVKYNTDRMVTVKDDEENEMPMKFNGSQYADVEMNLKIDIGPSSSYSESLMMSTLDMLYNKQAIDTMDFLDFAPKNVVPFKDRLKKRLEEKQAQAQNNQMMGIMQQFSQLPPQEREAFFMANPEQQMAVMQQMMQPQPNQPQQPQMM